MRAETRRLLADARVLGRRLEPDLDAAFTEVTARASRRRDRRGTRSALALSAVLLLGGALPAIAALRAAAGRTTHGVAAGNPSGDVTGSRAALGVAIIEPAVAISRGQVAPSRLHLPSTSAVAAATDLEPCAVSDLTIEMAFDSPAYDVGQPVGVTQVLRNGANRPCSVPLDACRSSISILDASGLTVYASGADTSWVCASAPTTVALAPGGTATLTFAWRDGGTCVNPACPGGAARAGRFTVEATWAGLPNEAQPLPRHVQVGRLLQS